MKKLFFLFTIFLVSLSIFGQETKYKNWTYTDFKLSNPNVSYSDMFNCLKEMGLYRHNSSIGYNKVGTNTGFLVLESDVPKICIIPQGKNAVNCIIKRNEGTLFKSKTKMNVPKFRLLVLSKKYGYEYYGYVKDETELKKIKNGESFIDTPEQFEKAMMISGYAYSRIEHYSQTSDCVDSISKIDDEVNSTVFDHLVREIKIQKPIYGIEDEDVLELYTSRECKKFAKIYEDFYPWLNPSNDCPQCAITQKEPTKSSTSNSFDKPATVKPTTIKPTEMKSVHIGPGAIKGK